MIYNYEYHRPMVTTDIIVFNAIEKELFVLLIKRKNDPFHDFWALPGGFVNENESLPDCAKRELFEETGLSNLQLEQFYTFGDMGRDPRGHTISVVYRTTLVNNKTPVKAGDDAKKATWFPVKNLPPLAFDHEKIIHQALN